jgi:hypothetical protein
MSHTPGKVTATNKEQINDDDAQVGTFGLEDELSEV